MSRDENSAREETLSAIRNAINHGQANKENQEVPLPTEGRRQEEVQYASGIDKFVAKLEQAKATVSVVNSRNDIVRAVHEYVASHHQESPITLAKDEGIASLDWSDEVKQTAYDPGSISISVTSACLGIEETGTLVLQSSPQSPTGLNFLPDYHVVVLETDKIVVSMDDVWKCMRVSQQEIPRTINLITGPSRTADIEQDLQFGAHGPKYLHVVLIQSAS